MRDYIKSCLQLNDFTQIYKKADNIRAKNVGDIVHIRAILEFSNICKRKCKYCGLNCKNKKIKRYRMTEDEIYKTAYEAANCGYKTLVMQSGEDDYFTIDKLGKIVKEVKSYGMYVTLSCGEMSYDEYKFLKECGADRYLLKHETSDVDMYDSLHPCGNLKDRLKCLISMKELGYEIGSGFMIGLPNQTLDTLTNDVLLLRELKCDMAGMGPFIPHPETELKNALSGSTELTKRCVALARILIPDINLPATTALNVISEKEKNDVFSCGANVIMKKVTPTEYKNLYEIYPANFTDTNIKKDRIKLEDQIKYLDRIPL